MKRGSCLILVLTLLAAFSGIPALAANGEVSSAPAAYYIDDTLYAFAHFPGYVPTEDDPLMAGLMVRGVQVGEAVEGVKLTERVPAAECMLLVDCSGSMPAYRAQIDAFTEALLSSAPKLSVTVAAFGDSFRVVETGLTDAGGVHRALSSLRYRDQGTDICGGAAYAVDYMKNNAWKAGELAAVVLITDGEPFYANDAAQEAESEAAAAEVLRDVLAASPQILLHAVSFAEWTSAVTHDAVTAAAGLDLLPRDAAEAAKAGAEAAAYYDALYGFDFPLQTYGSDLSLRIGGRDMLTIRHAGDLTAQEAPVFDQLPAIVGREDDPQSGGETAPEESPEPTDAPAETEAPAEATELPEPSPAPSAEPSAEPPDTAPPAGPVTAPAAEASSGGLPTAAVAAIIGGAVLLIAIAVLLILLLRKRGQASAGSAAPQAAPAAAANAVPGALPLRLEVLYGTVQGENRLFYLAENLMIGSDPRCDLVIPDASVAPVHCRIFRDGQAVWIEDLNSAAGTALGGMRIYAPNPLRSGDEIMVGQVCVAFYF